MIGPAGRGVVSAVSVALAVSGCVAGSTAQTNSESRPVRAGSAPDTSRPVDRWATVPERLVTLSLARDSYPTYATIVAKGRLQSGAPDKQIVLQRRLGADDWRRVGITRTHAGGRYRWAMPNRVPGHWRVRAWSPSSTPRDGTSAHSGVHAYRVNALLNPIVTRVTRQQLGRTYRPGCPVGPADLRKVRFTFHTYGRRVARGTLVVNRSIVDDVREVFGVALRTGFPLHSVRPVSVYGGSDLRSMRHDNTSAFNCRDIVGQPGRLSNHSYGTALDINTVRNPYQDSSGRWYPRTFGAFYRNRDQVRPGMLFARSPVTRAFLARGYQWGGLWSHPDYQHFDRG